MAVMLDAKKYGIIKKKSFLTWMDGVLASSCIHCPEDCVRVALKSWPQIQLGDAVPSLKLYFWHKVHGGYCICM